MRARFPWSPIYVVLLATSALAAVAQQSLPPGHGAVAETIPELTPIRSQAALDTYLRKQAGKSTPFDALPPGARERFFLSLSWAGRGLGSFDPDVLADELPQEQIHAILRLFGDEVARYAPPSRLPAGTSFIAVDGISDLERRYNDFYHALRQDEPDMAALSALLAERFDTLLAEAYVPAALRAIDDRHLAMLWNAAEATAKLSSAPRHVIAMEAVLAETTRRTGTPPHDRLRAMRNVLLASQRFEDARHLLKRYPDAGLPALPEFIDSLGSNTQQAYTAWRMAADGLSLVRQPIALAGTRILVTAGCHFSRDAAEDILADPALGPVFARNAYWLMLPPGDEDIDAVQDWNRRFPEAPAQLIYSRAEWPILPAWPMPRFHIVRDGRIIDTLTGWPRGETNHREALARMLRRAGLME